MKALFLSVFLAVSSLLQGAYSAQVSLPHSAHMESTAHTKADVYAHPRLLVVGDGLSVGADATSARNRYVALLAQSLHARLTVRAAGGLETPALYTDLQSDPPAPADIIVVELGTDDGWKDYQPFLQDYPALLALLRHISPNALLVCSGPWEPYTRVQNGDAAYVQNVCQAQGGQYVDLQQLYDVPAYHWTTTNRWLAWLSVYSDPFLPNDAGMAAISSAILAPIRSEIAQREVLPPSPLVAAIIIGCVGGFFIVMVFALPVNGWRRRRAKRK